MRASRGLQLIEDVMCDVSVYLGLSSGGALLKLTTGIWRVAGRVWSDGGRKGRGGRRGDLRGELRPRVRRRGERGALDTECCSSSFSSSSRIAGSFFTRPPLLSQSTWDRPSRFSYVCVCTKRSRYTCLRSAEVSLSGKIRAILLQYLQGNRTFSTILFFIIIIQLMPLNFLILIICLNII